jgi:hypothetical protein
MQLPFFNKNKKKDYYLGLLLKEDQGVAIIISSQIGVTEVVDFEKFNYTNGWENLAEDIDEVLYRLESKHKIHLEETIFFVYSHLVDEKTNQIKKPFQQKIKKLTADLELKPLGFIDCREAVIKTLEEKDENKLTGITIELDKNSLSLFIYKAGEIIFGRSVARAGNIIDNLNLIFDEIRGKILLPTRIILYNSKDLDFEVTRIVSHRWPTDLFIQLPRVEIVSEKEIIQSLVNLFKAQISLEKIEEAPKTEETVAGFVIGQDVKDMPQKPKVSFPQNNFFKKIKLPKLNWSVDFSFIKPLFQKKVLIFLGVIIIFFSLFINEYFFHKAKITIFVPSKNLEQSLTILAGEDGGVDLKIKPISKVLEISSSKATTGKKNIGEAASGEVTLYNFGKEITFPKGTKITTKGLSFSLDEEVKVASSSLTTDGSAKLPGKAKGKVTALEIGSQSNLSKGQTFKIADFDPEVYFAKNEADFSGGFQKQITTVSEDDKKDLETEVFIKAKKTAMTNFHLPAEEKLINELTKTVLSEKNFSKEVGEEAENISLKAKVETTIYSYVKADLLNILYNQLKKEIAPDFILDKKQISYQINKVEENKKNFSLKILASGKAIKTFDKNLAIKKLLGRSEKNIEPILKQNFEIKAYQLVHKQPLAIFYYKNLLPFFSRNFTVEFDSL